MLKPGTRSSALQSAWNGGSYSRPVAEHSNVRVTGPPFSWPFWLKAQANWTLDFVTGDSFMGKRIHCNKKVYARRLGRITVSIDYLLRVKLGFPPWRCNPRFLADPCPVPEQEVIDYLRALCDAHDHESADEPNDDDK